MNDLDEDDISAIEASIPTVTNPWGDTVDIAAHDLRALLAEIRRHRDVMAMLQKRAEGAVDGDLSDRELHEVETSATLDNFEMRLIAEVRRRRLGGFAPCPHHPSAVRESECHQIVSAVARK